MKLTPLILTTILTLSIGACSTQEANHGLQPDNTDDTTPLRPEPPPVALIESKDETADTPVNASMPQTKTDVSGQVSMTAGKGKRLSPTVVGNSDPSAVILQPLASEADAEHRRATKPAGRLKASARKQETPASLSANIMDKTPRAKLAQPSALFSPVPLEKIRLAATPLDRENYAHFENNPVKRVSEQPVSTFSIDVDTGSYTNVRRILREGRLPAKDAVRAEEFVNYFSYDYPPADSKQRPFNVTTEIGHTPWNPATYLLHIGIKGYDVSRENLPASNLVFLLDVSGSMHNADKLPLLKNGLKLLTNTLRPQDSVAIVVYAGASGVVLPSTTGDHKYEILAALEQLSAGGSTNGASGIHLAYQVASESFIPGGINRVILATDGDFNVGTVNFDALKNLVEEKRQTGISLTTLGFGTGNYNDKLMEQLADAGNGNYAYIDSLLEAQKSLIDEIGSTLMTIAKDVKIQIEFNPKSVAEYRLIGYENRALKREDFNNDKIDAGEIGAGHTVTAIYEIALTGQGGEKVDPLRYQTEKTKEVGHQTGELAFLKIRYKQPNGQKSILISQAIGRDTIIETPAKTTDRFRFSASVVAFAQLLRGGQQLDKYNFDDVMTLAQKSKGDDKNGYRGEFINLVKLANSIKGPVNTAARD